MKYFFLTLIFISCSRYKTNINDNEVVCIAKKTDAITQKKQMQFVSSFCNELVIVKVKNKVVFNKQVTSPYCSGSFNDASNSYLVLEKNWDSCEIILPNKKFKQKIEIIPDKLVALYLGEKNDTIYVRNLGEGDLLEY